MYQINTNPRAKTSDTREYARMKIKLALPILSYKNKNMQQINTNPRAQNSDTRKYARTKIKPIIQKQEYYVARLTLTREQR